MLEFSKEEIACFASDARIHFREDASNASTEFERNWVRLELLPLLRKRQPAVGKNILRAMQIVGADADFVTKISEAWQSRGSSHPDCLLELLPVAMQRRVVQLQIRALGLEPDFQLVEALRTQPSKQISVGPQLELMCDTSGLVTRVQVSAGGFDSREQVVNLSQLKRDSQAVEVNFGKLRLAWRLLRRPKHFAVKREAGREYFDADKVGASLVLRHWRAGDRFQPIGMAQGTKLQDWFTNRKVSATRRRQLILAESERGEVFWVEGERISEGCKVTLATRRVLEMRWPHA
jgi:tRNA(Ile)-lysidine synthase